MVLAPAALFAQGVDYVRANYTKYEFRIPMRDGARLFTAVYVPKDTSKSYPILLNRTPYSVGPYGEDNYRGSIGPSELFAKEGYIVALQDVRGRYMSEGQFVEVRPHNPAKKSPKEIDESSDTWDTIDWLVKNVQPNNGKVGLWGISYPGFYVLAGMIDAHPALVAVSPQAPVTDYYLGDDSYHNGAFMLAANFGFYSAFVERKGDPEKPGAFRPFPYGTPDGYDFYLRLGSLANADERYFHRQNPYWTSQVERPNYDEYWRSRSIWRYFQNIRPAVLAVGGWFDAEDLQGPLRVFSTLKTASPTTSNSIVMGPWTHGSWARGDGTRVGDVDFGQKASLWFRENVEFPFFQEQLKGKKEKPVAKATVFQTGVDEWRQEAVWPPADAVSKKLYLREGGTLTWDQGASGAQEFDEYVSDPNKPVPYLGTIAQGMARDYMTADQRFASRRTDVLTYRGEVLESDLTVAGPVGVHLVASTSGTDSDFVVKLIDEYPGDHPTLGGYQQLVRGEPFRARFRNGFEKPEAMPPDQPQKIDYAMPDICHTFRRGHRILVQVQSSWFPLTDRNPQKFVDVWRARPEDYTRATQRIYRTSTVELLVTPTAASSR